MCDQTHHKKKIYKQVKCRIFNSKNSYTGVVNVDTVSSQPITVKVERIGNTVTLDIPGWRLTTIIGGIAFFSVKIDPKYRPTQEVSFVESLIADNFVIGKVKVDPNGNLFFGTWLNTIPFPGGVDAGFLHTGISYLVD